ncbi:hypothetical protein ACF9IK_04660 [Kitasatospora hibisci]|uniref:hypothetical protein n=1 Tax=Kitasatospora hibisci TaxID=3369522 RepID=UPI00375455A6
MGADGGLDAVVVAEAFADAAVAGADVQGGGDVGGVGGVDGDVAGLGGEDDVEGDIAEAADVAEPGGGPGLDDGPSAM